MAVEALLGSKSNSQSNDFEKRSNLYESVASRLTILLTRIPH